MRHSLSFIIVAFYALGLGFSDPSKSFAPSIKVKIEHTHEVTQEHHHHDVENETDHEHDVNGEHKHSHPHSHEVSISMSGGYVLSSGSIIPVNINIKSAETVSAVYNEIPPKDISLNSIFRPPIA